MSEGPQFLRIEKEEKPESEKLKDLGQEELSCYDCGCKPVLIQKVKDLPVSNKFKLQCFCGGSSFVCTYMGKVYVAAKEGFYIEDIIYNARSYF